MRKSYENYLRQIIFQSLEKVELEKTSAEKEAGILYNKIRILFD